MDVNSPIFFQMCCSGTPFKQVDLALRKASGSTASSSDAQDYLVFTFKLVAVHTISWAAGNEGPAEVLTFEYGALDVSYYKQNADGTSHHSDLRGLESGKECRGYGGSR